MFKELFLAAIISASVSVRTPNDDTKPLDYEFSVRAEKNEGNFTYNAKRDWERELGHQILIISGGIFPEQKFSMFFITLFPIASLDCFVAELI